MPKGRKPKPALIRQLEGNRSKSKIPDTVHGLGDPVCNPDLTPDEQRFWFAIVDSLPGGLLTRADEQALERAAIAWARMWECRKKINERGLTINGQNGPVRNPLVMIERDSREELHRAGEVLGLSPVARSRITAPDSTGSQDPTELLMAGVEAGAWSGISDTQSSSVVPFPRRKRDRPTKRGTGPGKPSVEGDDLE